MKWDVLHECKEGTEVSVNHSAPKCIPTHENHTDMHAQSGAQICSYTLNQPYISVGNLQQEYKTQRLQQGEFSPYAPSSSLPFHFLPSFHTASITLPPPNSSPTFASVANQGLFPWWKYWTVSQINCQCPGHFMVPLIIILCSWRGPT